MVAVLTGDIINSEKHPSAVWLPVLKAFLNNSGMQPRDWDIYRGDEFQLRIPAKEALKTAIHLKATLKTIKGIDVRLAIGLGEERHSAARITEANGTAYQRSGRTFESLKEQKVTLALSTADPATDKVLNLMIKLGLSFMDEWSTVSAKAIDWALKHPDLSQQETAVHFKIQQSAVSQQQKRARLDLVMELLEYYLQTVKKIPS